MDKLINENLDNSKKIKGSNNILLHLIGNICGWLSHKFLKISMRWGTWYELDMDDDDQYGPEYNIDEVW